VAVADVYEWIPASIVAMTFLVGLVAESVEARRFRYLRTQLSR